MTDATSPAPEPNQALAREFGLSADEYAKVLEIMGRTPTLTELGVFSVMWSEHCCYKSSRVWLRQLPTKRALGDPRPGRERRRGRYRRRPGRHLQDGEPQPPELHRALPGRGDRRRRHPARRVHHGRPADRQPERAALRQSRPPAHQADRRWRGARHRRLRQLRRRADRRRRDQLPPRLRRQPAGQRDDRRHRADGPHLPSPPPPASAIRWSMSARKTGRDGIHGATMASRRVRRRLRGKAPDRAGRRPVHREAADRGLPGTDGDRRHRRHPGHGRRRPDQFLGRDGRQGRRRHRARPRPGAGSARPA